MQPIQSYAPVGAPLAAGYAAPPAEAPGSLMPPAADGVDDAMMTVYALMANAQTTEMIGSKAEVTVKTAARDKALADQKAAIAKEQANEANQGHGFFSCVAKLVKDVVVDGVEGRLDKAVKDTGADVKAAVDSPKFWSDLEIGAKVVATVAAVAATVATAGAAGPVVAAVAIGLSAGGVAVSETKCLDNVLGAGWSARIGVGLELASAAFSCGASFVTAASTGGSQALATAGAVAGTTSGGATIVAGGAHIENARFQANVADAQADETQAKNEAAKQERLTQWLLDNLSAEQSAKRDAMATIQNTITQHGAETISAAQILKRG